MTPFREGKILIREEYTQLYNHLEVLGSAPHMPGRPPCAIVTSQPGGIGKLHPTTETHAFLSQVFYIPDKPPFSGDLKWVHYAVIRRLSEKKPFLWHYEGRWCSITGNDVYVQRRRSPPDQTLTSPLTWVFFDACYMGPATPVGLGGHGFTKFLIFITPSPSFSTRLKKFDKTMSPKVLLMNPWSRAEIHAA